MSSFYTAKQLRFRVLGSLLVLALAAGCRDAGNSASDPPSRPSAAACSGDDDTIHLIRYPCDGRCPTYELKLRKNGDLEWYGFEHVATVGPASARLPADEASVFLTEWSEALAELASKTVPRDCYTDYPTTDIELRVCGTHQRLLHDSSCDDSDSERLALLIEKLSAHAKSRSWLEHPACVGRKEFAISYPENEVDPRALVDSRHPDSLQPLRDMVDATKTSTEHGVRIRVLVDKDELAEARLEHLRSMLDIDRAVVVPSRGLGEPLRPYDLGTDVAGYIVVETAAQACLRRGSEAQP